ncbi:MAG: hypothetical protein K8R88_15865 [Armatimonadetes bacterium]|nr:hypothetical protein [Armatimonadota bacterium]
MQILAVPNWSFGRNRALQHQFEELLSAKSQVVAEPGEGTTYVSSGLKIHFCQGDVDHNRTVTAFSGESSLVFSTILELASVCLDTIDLTRHVGVHPRIGGLDVCPFVPLEGTPGDIAELILGVENFAKQLADRYELPVFLYEKSEKGRHESDLPSLRKGGFGGLLDRELRPDYGPICAHPRLGATIVGVRDFLIAMNANFRGEDLTSVKRIAQKIRQMRQEGDPRFLGVRALGLPLASRNEVQVSMNLTLPDLTPIDPILEEVQDLATGFNCPLSEFELIGVIRRRDLEHATMIPFKKEQVIE